MAQLAIFRQMSRQVLRGSAGVIKQMSRQVSRGSAGEYQATEQAGVARLSWRFSGRRMEKAMAPHSSTLAWRIPGTGEPGGLPSMASHRVGHD